MKASPTGKGNKDLEGSVIPVLFYHYISTCFKPGEFLHNAGPYGGISSATQGLVPVRTLLYPFFYISERGI